MHETALSTLRAGALTTQGSREIKRGMEAFKQMFEPHGDGYLYYPHKGGGRFVTKAEYEALLANHRRWLHRRSWRLIVFVMAVIVILMMVAKSFDLSEDAQTITLWIAVLSTMAYVAWFASAPSRLVKRRPAVTPPLSAAERRRRAREMFDERFGYLFTFGSAAVLIYCLAYPENTARWWGTTLFCAAMVILAVVYTVQRYRDRREGSGSG